MAIETLSSPTADIYVEKHFFGESLEFEDNGWPDNMVDLVLGPDNPEMGVPDFEYWIFSTK